MRKVLTFPIVLCAAGAITLAGSSACSAPQAEGPSSGAPAASTSPAPSATGGLTAFELEHGIGPVTSPMTLDARVDKKMAEEGEEIFEQKCSACHKMTERYVGPPLGDVTKRRSPAFIMNMALNPQGMVEKHPETQKLLAEFFVPMPNQGLTADEARQVLEYLREESD